MDCHHTSSIALFAVTTGDDLEAHTHTHTHTHTLTHTVSPNSVVMVKQRSTKSVSSNSRHESVCSSSRWKMTT